MQAIEELRCIEGQNRPGLRFQGAGLVRLGPLVQTELPIQDCSLTTSTRISSKEVCRGLARPQMSPESGEIGADSLSTDDGFWV